MPDTCDAICRLSLAHAVCSELLSHQGVIALALTVNGSSLVAAGDFRPLLRERSALLSREFGCTVQNRLVSAPPMQQKSVADGKSGSGFLVGGGDGVSADQPSSYGVLLKQLSPGEAALLPSLLPRLMDRYASGSLLARFFGWVRYADPARGRPFEAVLMDNVARPPPGIWPGSASRWRPFDMKGIRLYKNERRFEAAFGQRGLRLAPRDFAALRRALELDVRLLTSLQLVDYSYLLSVVAASPASPRACGQPGGGSGRAYEAVAPSLGSRARRTHGRWDPGENGGDEAGGVALAVPKLIEACYCANASAGAPIVTGKSGGAAGGLSTGDAGGRGETVGDAGGEGGAVQGDARNTMRPTASAPHEEATGVAGQVGGAEAGGGAGWGVTLGAPSTARWPDTRGPDRAPAAASGGVRCERVLVRLALIDYLREWRLVEIGEHVQKTLQRDLFARERASSSIAPLRTPTLAYPG